MDAERIIKIGADKAKVEVYGNVKYDIQRKLTDDDVLKLRKELELTEADRVIIAGSTHSSEEESVLSAFKELSQEIDNLKLILVPRHPERYQEVVELLTEAGSRFGYRSKKNTFKDVPILLLDTMGELSGFYSISMVAFVGGSLIPKGGHNPLEPALYNVPVIMGEYVFNFSDICNYMVECESLLLVKNSSDLTTTLRRLLTDKLLYVQMQEACSHIFAQNRGATNKILGYLEETVKNNIYNS